MVSSALLEKELKIKDEKIHKMKAVAIKAKKELDISKKEVGFSFQSTPKDYKITYPFTDHVVTESVVTGLFQVASLSEEVGSLKTEREKMSSSMKDIIHGAEGYKVGVFSQRKSCLKYHFKSL